MTFAELLGKRFRNDTPSEIEDMAEELIRILRERTGIFREVAPNTFDFIHRTFKEYLAARLLSDRFSSSNRNKKLGDRIYRSEWREVILLMCATLNIADATEFIKFVMNQPKKDLSHLLLVGECVVDVGIEMSFDAIYDDLWTEEGLKWLKSVKVECPVWWNDRKLAFPNAPVVGVSWYEADAFCRWLTQTRNDGYRYYLPTADQWQAAAAGVGKRKYPWGEWKEGISNTKESGIEKISTVGIFEEGNTPSGISDMFGNVWEWSCSEFLSWVTKSDFEFDPKIQKLWDDQNIDELRKIWKELKGKLPSLLGISWINDGFGYGGAACNDLNNPDGRNGYVGFRCSRTFL